MSQPQGTEAPVIAPNATTGAEGTGTQTPEETVPVTNELWEPILRVIPPALHEAVVPTLKNWDSGFQTLLAKKLEEYEPYKDFVGKVEADELVQAVNLLRLAESDPEKVYNALAEHLGKNQQQQQQQAPSTSTTPVTTSAEQLDPDDPMAQQIALLKAQNEQILAVFQQQQQQQSSQQQNEQLKNYLDGVHAKFPEADMEYVISRVALGHDGYTVAQEYLNKLEAAVQAKLQPQQQAPVVLGGTGGTPSNKLDLKNLNEEQVKALVAQTLQQNRQT